MTNQDTFYQSAISQGLFKSFSDKQKSSISELLTTADQYFTDKRHIAYLLATAYHETAFTMLPISEYGKDSDFLKYDTRTDLGNTPQVDGDGAKYKGRGYVQITGTNNYKTFSRLLNVDLINHPELALNADIAAKIACVGMRDGLFTGKKLSDYFNAKVSDPVNARKIINGLDRAQKIAGYYAKFMQCV